MPVHVAGKLPRARLPHDAGRNGVLLVPRAKRSCRTHAIGCLRPAIAHPPAPVARQLPAHAQLRAVNVRGVGLHAHAIGLELRKQGEWVEQVLEDWRGIRDALVVRLDTQQCHRLKLVLETQHGLRGALRGMETGIAVLYLQLIRALGLRHATPAQPKHRVRIVQILRAYTRRDLLVAERRAKALRVPAKGKIDGNVLRQVDQG